MPASNSATPSPTPSPTHRFTLIAALYVSQAVPLGFFIVGLPAILRSEQVALANVGLVSALAAPFLLKFLWAPLVDRMALFARWGRWGHYRSWIFVLQALSVAAVLGLSGLSLEEDFGLLLLGGGLFMLFASTQDVATDGLAVHVLRPEERGIGNGIQVGGYYLGQILGGGALVAVFGTLGWQGALLAMAVVLALPLLPLSTFREPLSTGVEARREAGRREGLFRKGGMAALAGFFRRSGAGLWVCVLLLFRAGETMATVMLGPMLVDAGWSLARVGVVMGVVASVAAFLGAMAGGTAVSRLGRRGSLALFGLLQAAALAALVIPAYLLPPSAPGGAIGVYVTFAILAAAGGMGTAALYTGMMDRSAKATAATDFSLQQALAAIGPLVGSGVAGLSAAALGYSGHFFLCTAVALATVALVVRGLPTDAAAEDSSAAGDEAALR